MITRRHIILYVYMHVLYFLGRAGAAATAQTDCLCGPTDILIALHNPYSATDFTKLIGFVGSFVRMRDLDRRTTRIGLMTFTGMPVSEVLLDANYDKDTLLAAINNTSHVTGGARTDLALRFAREVGFNSSTGADVAKVLVLLTDRLSNQPGDTRVEANKTHHDNITVLTVGVGPYVDESELIQIASDSLDFFRAPNFDALYTIEADMNKRLCEITCLRATSAPVQKGCIYKGSTYHQGQRWNDGCDRLCVCESEMTGHFRCYQRCPSYSSVPAGCTLDTDPSDPCCRVPVCSPIIRVATPAAHDALQTSSTPASGSVTVTPQDNKGQEFVLMFMENYRLGTQVFPPEIYVTTQEKNDVHVHVTTPKWSTPKVDQSVTVREGQVAKIILDAALRMTGSDVSTKAILITADADVACYCANKETLSNDAYLGLPTDTLGTDYYAVSHSPASFKTEIGVASTADSTYVKVTLPSNNGNLNVTFKSHTYNPGDVINVTLNMYETLQLQSDGDLTGAHIETDQPVAAFSGNIKTNIGKGTFQDHLVEMLVPADRWGKRFATVPIPNRTVGDVFRIVAKEDNTVVNIPGQLQIILHQGDSHVFELPSSAYTYITASDPVMLAQFVKSQQSCTEPADPAMMIIPPVEQFGSDYTFTTPEYSHPEYGPTFRYKNEFMVVAKKAEVDGLLLDGKPFPQVTWHDIPGTDLVGGYTTLPHGAHTVRHVNPLSTFGGYLYGHAYHESYGFPTGMRTAVIYDPNCTVTPSVPGDGIDNDCDNRIDEELCTPDNHNTDDDGDGRYDEDCAKTTPIDGFWGEWSSWDSTCSVTCGNGTVQRARMCDSPAPKFGGKNCTGQATDTKPCNGVSTCGGASSSMGAQTTGMIPGLLCITRWSPWINTDTPTTGNGDREGWTFQQKAAFCPGVGRITSIECKTTTDIMYYSTGESVTCTIDNGLECLNDDNFPVHCSDYQIRYQCTCTDIQTPPFVIVPSLKPDETPTAGPSLKPGETPTAGPSLKPGETPIAGPSLKPVETPTAGPSLIPGETPTAGPSLKPGETPTAGPSLKPGETPTAGPSLKPGETPTAGPSLKPGETQTAGPSLKPGETPTAYPFFKPSETPTYSASLIQGETPTADPSFRPSVTSTAGLSLIKGHSPPSSTSSSKIYPSATADEMFDIRRKLESSIRDNSVHIFVCIIIALVLLCLSTGSCCVLLYGRCCKQEKKTSAHRNKIHDLAMV